MTSKKKPKAPTNADDADQSDRFIELALEQDGIPPSKRQFERLVKSAVLKGKKAKRD